MSELQSREQLLAMDNEHFVHPWEGVASLGSNERTFAERGDGVYIYDEAGNRYLDGPGGMWCMQLGYGQQRIADAMSRQAMQLGYFSPWYFSSSPAAKLAEQIAQRSPGDLNRVFFTTCGSTAVDSALRFTQFFNNALGRPEKKQIISREKAYHGSTYLAATVSGKERDKSWMDTAESLVHILPDVSPSKRGEGVSEAEFLDAKVADLEAKILEVGADKVAAFIAEPILASGGLIVPVKGYHQRCLAVCRKYDVLYISDEVVTAFGRLGHWFASEDEFDIVPDMITCAKGLTSGYIPMGATLISDALFERIKTERPDLDATYSNGYTYSGHPIAAAVALECMAIFEEDDILQHVKTVAPRFQKRLLELRELPLVVDTRGVGLMGCVECVATAAAGDDLAMDMRVGERIDAHCQRMGLLVRPLINMCVISPALIITKAQIDEMFDVLRQGILDTAEELRAEGCQID